jgi:hypothetical protein
MDIFKGLSIGRVKMACQERKLVLP